MNPENKNKSINFNIWSREKDKRIGRFLIKTVKLTPFLIVLIGATIIIKDEVVWQMESYGFGEDYSYEGGGESEYLSEGECNVQGIELHGDLATYISPAEKDEEGNPLNDQSASENIVMAIEGAEKDETIKAIILEIDSYGGYPVAGEEIAKALKIATKPTVALIREGGASAAYMAASGADRIFASKNSDVGSIAVTASHLDNVQKNQKDGLSYVSLSSGKFKDTGDPDKPMSLEEKNLLMRDINIIHQNFVELVSENRKLETSKVKAIADGSTMLGEMALKNGLIDQIGGLPEVKTYLKDKIGEDVELCW